MKRINTKKLGLATETVRNLEGKTLEDVRGGMMANNTFTYCTGCQCSAPFRGCI
ncbi:MAG TPA: hypothetical protein VL463_21220 [Kofleriaceae bacterium]|jgi:hypothetical protein|nr:hypothetical protein [Kofleriaceae bacterium]